MKFLISSPPTTGHFNPMLSIARILMARGHEVVMTTASFLRKRVEEAGVPFAPLLPGADIDTRDMGALFPEHRTIPPGPALVLAQLGEIVRLLPDQAASLRQILTWFDADAIVSDVMFNGTLALLLDRSRPCPPVIHVCPNFLLTERDDGAPVGPGLPPAETDAQRAEYRSIRKEVDLICLDPVKARLDQLLAECGVGPTTLPYFDSLALLPDLFLELSIPGLEYPRQNLRPSVRFIGALPVPPSTTPDPDWIGELDGSRRVVLVTQGTLANFDLGQLIGPALAGLADEPDLLVLATTGGRPLSDIPGRIPANARVAEFLPFDRLMHHVDVLVTNGGFGTVNLALKAGIPLVVAGMTEDKAEISARVAWSGAGINLATNNAAPDAVRAAVRTVLAEPSYRHHAQRLAAEFTQYDTEAEVVRLVEDCVQRTRVRALRLSA
jgi:UDP:flavonoid glycosyltransferase YjiC (YdhE family)